MAVMHTPVLRAHMAVLLTQQRKDPIWQILAMDII